MAQDPQRQRSITSTGRNAIMAAAAFAIMVMVSIALMMGDNGTQNDANNRGPSGVAQNRSSDNPPAAKVPSREENTSKQP